MNTITIPVEAWEQERKTVLFLKSQLTQCQERLAVAEMLLKIHYKKFDEWSNNLKAALEGNPCTRVHLTRGQGG